MDTDAVRGMAVRTRQTGDNLDARVDAILLQIENMEWQSNARTEFDGNFKSIHRNIKTIANAMRLMGSAADAKASQWETIASKLLGPFVAVQNFWQDAIDHLGSIGAVIGAILFGGISRWILPWTPRKIIDDGSIHIMPFPYPPGKRLLPIWPIFKPGIPIKKFPPWLPDRPGWLPKPGLGISNGGGSEGGSGSGGSSSSGGSSGGGGGGGGGGSWGPDSGNSSGNGASGVSGVGSSGSSNPSGGGASGGGGGAGGGSTGGGGGGAGGGSTGGGGGGGGGGSAGGGSTGGGGGGSSGSAPRMDIPSSRTPPDKLGILGGCTNYVATKRDVSGFWKPGRMNATYWNENAAAAGYGVGNKPVAGSIMVVEADNGVYNGVMDVNDQAGHVLYVESVKETSGGYLVSYSHAGTLYDAAGNYIPGTYKMLPAAPVFVPYESPAVSFIYDKI